MLKRVRLYKKSYIKIIIYKKNSNRLPSSDLWVANINKEVDLIEEEGIMTIKFILMRFTKIDHF
jgi:hypothetical protein